MDIEVYAQRERRIKQALDRQQQNFEEQAAAAHPLELENPTREDTQRRQEILAAEQQRLRDQAQKRMRDITYADYGGHAAVKKKLTAQPAFERAANPNPPGGGGATIPDEPGGPNQDPPTPSRTTATTNVDDRQLTDEARSHLGSVTRGDLTNAFNAAAEQRGSEHDKPERNGPEPPTGAIKPTRKGPSL